MKSVAPVCRSMIANTKGRSIVSVAGGGAEVSPTITALAPVNRLRAFPPSFFPTDPQWQTFVHVLTERPVPLWLTNSLIAALGATALSMSVSILAAYSLSRFRVRGGPSLGLFILISKMLPATLLVIPLFAIFRELKLIGSLWSIILAHATLIVPFSTWMLKGYFDSIPRELEQAAQVDGCTPLGALWRVVLPVSAPGLAATAPALPIDAPAGPPAIV